MTSENDSSIRVHKENTNEVMINIPVTLQHLFKSFTYQILLFIQFFQNSYIQTDAGRVFFY